MVRRLMPLRLAIVGLFAIVTACSGSSSSSDAAAPTDALDVFAAQFDAGVGHRRLVLLMSPT
jgi:hypothetical protein